MSGYAFSTFVLHCDLRLDIQIVTRQGFLLLFRFLLPVVVLSRFDRAHSLPKTRLGRCSLSPLPKPFGSARRARPRVGQRRDCCLGFQSDTLRKENAVHRSVKTGRMTRCKDSLRPLTLCYLGMPSSIAEIAYNEDPSPAGQAS
jgi:hypothetical protein